MAYNTILAERVRKFLTNHSQKPINEKKMFGGHAFLVDDKMCINVSGENLMCRFDPELQATIENKKGYHKMLMRGKEFKGYCYVSPEGFSTEKEFRFWLNLCLDFNSDAIRRKG